MHNLKFLPYKMGSGSAKELSRLLTAKRVHPDGGYVPKIGHTVINWGSSTPPNWIDKAKRRDVTILNNPSAVKNASDKLRTLEILSEAGVSIPPFTTDKRVAKYWLDDGATVVERHVLNSNRAKGARVVNLDDDDLPSTLQDAPLYTKFIPKQREFRVHVFNGKVIDYIEKKKVAKEKRPENFNKYLCANEMGWIFCRNDILHIESVKQIALDSVKALRLDFAAVDIIYHNEIPYVLEANTAPGIMGLSLTKYVNAIRSFFGLTDLKFKIDYNQIINNDGDPLVEIDTSFDSALAESNVREPVTSTFSPPRAAPSALDSGKMTIELDRTLVKTLIAALSKYELS